MADDDVDKAEAQLNEQSVWGESAQDRALRWLVESLKKSRDRDVLLRQRMKDLEDRVTALEKP